MKEFAILVGYQTPATRARYAVLKCPTTIPWAMIEPHEAQARKNHYQSLERLNERGGLSPCEIVAVLEDKDCYLRWPHTGPTGLTLAGYDEDAIRALNEQLAEYRAAHPEQQ
jgi:hypothetical protein